MKMLTIEQRDELDNKCRAIFYHIKEKATKYMLRYPDVLVDVAIEVAVIRVGKEFEEEAKKGELTT